MKPAQHIASFYILGSFPSATQFYFLAPALSPYKCHWWSIHQALDSNQLLRMAQPGDKVVICRYLSLRLIGTLKVLQKQGIDLIYFMDDDLLDLGALRNLPWTYAYRLWRKATLKKPIIMKLFNEIWVSNSVLAKKYSNHFCDIPVKILWPLVIRQTIQRADAPHSINPNRIEIGYHGSWSHKKEMQWLSPILQSIQTRYAHTYITIFGDSRVQAIFQNIPRLAIQPTLSWSSYLRYTLEHPIDIGLAPLLDTPFNQARSPTKFFDYARCRAVGIYSQGPVYQNLVINHTNGLLLANQTNLWVEQLSTLIEDPSLRQMMVNNAWNTVLENQA